MDLSEKLQSFSLSDKGIKRMHNEDSVGSRPEQGLFVLADGMGGYKAGEVASAIAVNTIIDRIGSALEKMQQGKRSKGHSPYTHESVITCDSVRLSNSEIHRTSTSQPEYNGMGTTVVVVLFYDDRMSIVHVGDSRLYRVRNSQLEQVTVDHSLVQELVSKGFYTPEEAKKARNKNLVTRALGVGPKVDVDVQEELVFPGDIYMLCSDGLSDMIDDSDILRLINQYDDDLEKTGQMLVQTANDNGGEDNVSVILVKCLSSFAESKGWFKRFVEWF